ncbi:MAG: hypothetical protein IJL85_03290 [Erysipelotrichaceae bacterium]|nr:hypothetical protein [Erysipelotrichaceae bacterium]
MELETIYREIESRLNQIDYSVLYRGFSSFPFALYDEKQAFLNEGYIEKPAEFIGNTSVRYEGKEIAIWNIMEEVADYDLLTSKIVHEMFHAYQHVCNEKRWADEQGALVKYHYDEMNVSLRLREGECFRKCLAEDSVDDFYQLISLRKSRRDLFPYEYDYESRIEQIEGSAHYVELSALKQLDETKADRQWTKLLSEIQDPSRYFPVRSVTYLTGAAFLACLKKYMDFDTDAFTEIPFSIAALDMDVPDMGIPSSHEIDEKVIACMKYWREKSEEIVKETIEKGDLVLDGDHKLVGWNVYDASWDGNYVILSYFIGYVEGMEVPASSEELFACMKMLNGDFVAEMDQDFRLHRVWKR